MSCFMIHCFKMIITIIFLILQVSKISCEVFLLKQQNIRDGNVTLTCLAIDQGNALVWNTDFETESPMKFSNNFSVNIGDDITCRMDNERDSCYKTWKTNGWKVTNSIDTPIGPVHDKRWEDFKEFNSHNSNGKKSVLLKEGLPSRGAIAFSIRTLFSCRLDLYRKSDNGKQNTWYSIAFDNGVLNMRTCADRYDGNDNSCIATKPSSKTGGSSEIRWKTFIIQWDWESKKMHSFHKEISKSSWSSNEFDFVSEANDKWQLLFIHQGKDYRLRLHDYGFLYTSEENQTISRPRLINPKNTTWCAQMWVALCVGCEIEIRYGSNIKYTSVPPIKKPNPNPRTHGYPIWQRVEMKSEIESHPINITIKTLRKEKIQNPFWAIRDVKNCTPPGTMRTAKIQLPMTSNLSAVNCQELKEYSSVVVSAEKIPVSSDDSKSDETNLCQRGKFGPGCIIDCKEHGAPGCRGLILCKEKKCICAPGLEGRTCNDFNRTALPGVEDLEIIEIREVDATKRAVELRWKLPEGMESAEIENYKVKLRGSNNCPTIWPPGDNEIIISSNSIWPGYFNGTIDLPIKTDNRLLFSAKMRNAEGKEALTQIVCIFHIKRHANVAEPPNNVKIESLSNGVTNFGWELPWRTNRPVTKFVINATLISTTLKSPPLENSWINGSVACDTSHYQLNYKISLNLFASSSYKIEIYAVHIYEVPGLKFESVIETNPSVNFDGPLLAKINNTDLTVCLTIPKIINDTSNSTIYVILMSSHSCTRYPKLTSELEAQVRDVRFNHTLLVDKFSSDNYGGKPLIMAKNEYCLKEDNWLIVMVGTPNQHGNHTTYIKRTTKIEFKNMEETEPETKDIWKSTESSTTTTERTPETPKNNNFMVLLVLCSLLIIIIVITVTIIYVYRKCSQRKSKFARKTYQSKHKIGNSKDKLLGKEQSVSEHENKLWEENLSINPENGDERKDSPTLIKIKDFENYVKAAINSKLLDQQYNTYVRGQTKPWTHGASPPNQSKNRYVNLMAYDQSRVVLEKLPDDPHSDYINANYIQGLSKDKLYIATQGPKDNTIVDFWRMIWQEETRIICMLANVVEDGKTKCEQYWPELGQCALYRDVFVRTIEENVSSDYTYRTFEATFEEETRKVQHLHFTAWPDHGVPRSTLSIVSYLRKVTTSSPVNGPIVVHCSAGVGRTGSIIVAHICLQRAATEGAIDVFSETTYVRTQRPNMVDNDQQYLFVHLVLVEYLNSFETDLPCNDTLPSLIRKLKNSSKTQRQSLKNRAWLDKILNPPLCQSMSERNMMKNRYSDLAYGAISRVFLRRYPKTDPDSDYISAVHVPGIYNPRQYIASQLPLPTTLNDFWRMITAFQIESVLLLQAPDLRDPTCCEIIPQNGSFQPTSYITVTSMESEKKEHCFIHKLKLMDNSEKPTRNQYVSIIIHTQWKPGRKSPPPPVNELLTLRQTVIDIAGSKKPVMVLCHDGVTACGIYLAMDYLLERMAVEKVCDVCSAVRIVRQARSDFVDSVEHFEYLYDAASIYLKYCIPLRTSMERNWN